ncbi:protein KRI1 homolog [Diachasma alloeum]|uniref:protein KRI1 homolog n=1 Tax=Diachasma alloeum TaxID=454923 RepID=UPI0007381EA6|nr:protein KRI1 homolog [Diachasma alloeum]
MDADYDSIKPVQEVLVSSLRKKRKRRSKFAEMISKDKPKFDPTFHTSYKDYFDQYYGLDYEDMIGNMPCRFKYRDVVPNDYGLSVDEILMADDRELNKWCSLKKALAHKPKHQELQEVKIYQEKSLNTPYKKKVLRSLYEQLDKSENNDGDNEESFINKKKNRRKKSNRIKAAKTDGVLISFPQGDNRDVTNKAAEEKVVINHLKKIDETCNPTDFVSNKEEPPKKKVKTQCVKRIEQEDKTGEETNNGRKKLRNSSQDSYNSTPKPDDSKYQKPLREKKYKQLQKMKKAKDSKDSYNPVITSLSDERLKAYGIKPKNFKKKMKYGLQSSLNMKLSCG